jgi:uncharacterized damage-inducible protein DinB
MFMSEGLIAELKHESVATRKLLERVPDASLDWQPHAKSMSLRRLASHMADIPKLAVPILTLPGLDFSQAPPPKPTLYSGRAELVAGFDEKVALAIKALTGVTDETMAEPWTLTPPKSAPITMPRAAALRSMLMNHLVHHRGQLTVYLRLLDVPLPAVYGPSADEAA